MYDNGLTVFPYYYLGGEYLRSRISARNFLLWAIVTVIVVFVVTKMVGLGFALLVVLLSIFAWIIHRC